MLTPASMPLERLLNHGLKKLEQSSSQINYFLLNPAGHLGEAPVTFFIVLPFTQVIEDVLGTLLTLVVGVLLVGELVVGVLVVGVLAVGVLGVAATGVLAADVGDATASFCFNLTFNVGEEKVIP